jgi:hypothetical protein
LISLTPSTLGHQRESVIYTRIPNDLLTVLPGKDRRTLDAFREYRDSVISYDVDDRESSIPTSRKGTIRLKLKRKPGEANGRITYVDN